MRIPSPFQSAKDERFDSMLNRYDYNLNSEMWISGK